jgi:hypothetical protein
LPSVEQPVAQRAALHERHHIVEKSVRLSGVVEGEDMRVREPGDNFDFLEESLDAEKGGEGRQQHLKGDFPMVLLSWTR